MAILTPVFIDDTDHLSWEPFGIYGTGAPRAVCALNGILYAFAQGALFSSTDAGLNWTDLNDAWPGTDTHDGQIQPLFQLLTDGVNLHLLITFLGGGGFNPLQRSVYDPVADTWAPTEVFTTVQIAHWDSAPNRYWATFRPDGSLLVASQYSTNPPFSDGNDVIQINKLVGSTWTLIATVGDAVNFWATLSAGIADAAGNVGLFYEFVDINGSGDCTLQYVSVRASDDVVSSPQSIEDIEFGAFAPTNSTGSPDMHPTTSELAYAYGYNTLDGPALDGINTGEVHLARGAGGILAPTWSTEVVDNTEGPLQAFNTGDYDDSPCVASYGGGVLIELCPSTGANQGALGQVSPTIGYAAIARSATTDPTVYWPRGTNNTTTWPRYSSSRVYQSNKISGAWTRADAYVPPSGFFVAKFNILNPVNLPATGRFTFAYTGKGSSRYPKNRGTRSRSVRAA